MTGYVRCSEEVVCLTVSLVFIRNKVTGLKSSTKYYYKVGSGSTFSAVHSFKTLPAPGTTPSKPTRISILADVGAPV